MLYDCLATVTEAGTVYFVVAVVVAAAVTVTVVATVAVAPSVAVEVLDAAAAPVGAL